MEVVCSVTKRNPCAIFFFFDCVIIKEMWKNIVQKWKHEPAGWDKEMSWLSQVTKG